MGYSTTLYAVDISELKAAFGSKEAALLARVRAAGEGAPRVDPTKGPRIRVNWKSEITLNGQPVTPDEFRHALLDAKWKGTFLYTCQDGPPRGEKRQGVFQETGSFARFLQSLGPFFQTHRLVYATHFAGINACTSPQQFADAGSGEDDITDDQALEELIAGKLTQPEHSPTYGYALERLCAALGERLGPSGTDQLKSLKVKTPLSKVRLPVRIPKVDDFPYISYLDAAEVRAEVERLRAMDLAYPADPGVEAERRRFLDLLARAADQGRGIVGFYY